MHLARTLAVAVAVAVVSACSPFSNSGSTGNADAASNEGVLCGAAQCGTDDVCCLPDGEDGGAAMCAAQNACAAAAAYYCNSSDECTAREGAVAFCCANANNGTVYGGSLCQRTPCLDAELCSLTSTKDACPPPESCVPAARPIAYGFCDAP